MPGAQDPLLEDARLGRLRFALAAWIPVAGVRLLAQDRRGLVPGLARRVRCLADGGSGAHLVDRRHGVQLDRGGLVGPEVEGEPRLVPRELVGRPQRKKHLAAVEDAVPALVGEGDPVLGDARQEEGAARSPPRAAHLELVGKVAGELVLHPVIDVVDEEVGEREPLHQLLVDELLAAQVEEVDRVGEEPAEGGAGDGEIDLRAVLGGRLRGEDHRRPSRYGQLELGEETGVLEIRALIAGAGRKDVPEPSRDGEEISLLEDQLLRSRRLGKLGQLGVSEQLLGSDGGQRAIRHAYPASAAVRPSLAASR